MGFSGCSSMTFFTNGPLDVLTTVFQLCGSAVVRTAEQAQVVGV
jgi:hypothetical protein